MTAYYVKTNCVKRIKSTSKQNRSWKLYYVDSHVTTV